LEQTGVLDALTTVLVGLYEEPERPMNAIDYIKRYMGAPLNVDVEGLKRENDSLKIEVEKLRKQQQQRDANAQKNDAV
jgi:predicted ATP-grasp superfamily ATP-dependent carboligase